jgi:8-oxo-dGTP pyrophosphatase MutT (NUDIX family)
VPAVRLGSVLPRDAATVMLVRDRRDGIEVFMLRRNLTSVFVAGAYVFPGGAVDASDGAPEIASRCRGRADADASATLGMPLGGLAFWVAAVRECFEESGLLLAADAEGEPIALADIATAVRFDEHRAELNAGRRSLADICACEGLHLDLGAMHYFSHWITPEGAPRRYDTRFFLAAAPPGQVPLHDNQETIAHLWIRPGEALRRHYAGDYEMIQPTVETLKVLDGFDRSEALLAAVARTEWPARAG